MILKKGNELNLKKLIFVLTIIFIFCVLPLSGKILNKNTDKVNKISSGEKILAGNIDTRINNSIFLRRNVKISLNTTRYFFFNYTTADTGEMISNCNIKFCEWYNTNETIIYNTSLTETTNGLYKLNIQTEQLEVGNYTLVVSIGKNNYTQRTAVIELKVEPFKKIFIELPFETISLQSNKELKFQVILMDNSNKSKLITGANVSLNFNNKEYYFQDNYNGSYLIEIPSSQIPPSFFTNKIYISQLIVSKENYTEQEVSLIIIVKMIEIFPGFPLFYFIIIIIGFISISCLFLIYYFLRKKKFFQNFFKEKE
ncbi:MAG: hypothetical protein P8Y70_18325 [Candidatus Lokiarchaeota archaeon]